MTEPFTPDYALTDAIIHAWETLASGQGPRASPRPVEQRGQRLQGVYATPRGLYARFSRQVDGKVKCFHVATGVMGNYSKDEEQRLHALWLVATAEWDAREGR